MAAEKPVKKEKKEKKAKRSETEGVTKPSSKKDKKDKKDKKEKEKKKLEKKLAENRDLDEKLQAAAAATAETTPPNGEDGEVEIPAVENIAAELVPFAIPLADGKQTKKVLKCVRTSAKSKTLKRGVKEVVKTLRKSASAGPTNTAFPGVVIIAGDISPMDVISHLPVLCEDHNVPYMFVTSRAELGAAGATKRPTSVVMVCEKRTGGGGKSKSKEKEKGLEEEKAAEAGLEEFARAYKDLVSLVQKATLKQVRV